MPTQFPRVNPGDVIKADQWNQVLAALEDLYSQIGAVSATQVAITGFIPPGPVKVGDQVTILGRNFQYSIGAQTVFFGGVPVSTFLLGSSDTQLVVNVPQLTNLPDQGQLVTVTVYNRTSNDSRQIEVVPLPVPVTGAVPVSAVPFTGTPAAGQTTNFSFVVTSDLSVTRSIQISATVTPSAWQGFLHLLDATPNHQPLGQLSLQPNGSAAFVAALAIPANTNGTPFTITINAIDVATGNSFGTSGTQSFVVGQASQVDPNVQFGKITAVGGQINALSGNIITMPANSSITIQIETTFKAAAQYAVTASLTAASGWQATMLNPPTGQLLDFRAGVPPTTTIRFSVQTLGSPASGGQLQIQGQTSGQALATALGFNLAVPAHA